MLCHAVSSDFVEPVIKRQDFDMMMGDHERLKCQALRFTDIEALLCIYIFFLFPCMSVLIFEDV